MNALTLAFEVLASGSKGNTIFVSSARTRILIDAGLSARETARRLHMARRLAQPHALLITHEHSDHVRGLGVLSQRLDLPVYLTQGTLGRMPASAGCPARAEVIRAGQPFWVGDLCVTAFSVPHDAMEPVGFVVEHDGLRLGICTDLGTSTEVVVQHLQGCQALILEANHDPDLLWQGPYPSFLKKRIASCYGHLSNVQTRDLLRSLRHDGLRTVVMAHLSEVNNSPDCLRQELAPLRAEPAWGGVRFELAGQYVALPAIQVA
jgi:phosphoribosyl 1,2-cyclic phosphodiesterase